MIRDHFYAMQGGGDNWGDGWSVGWSDGDGSGCGEVNDYLTGNGTGGYPTDLGDGYPFGFGDGDGGTHEDDE